MKARGINLKFREGAEIGDFPPEGKGLVTDFLDFGDESARALPGPAYTLVGGPGLGVSGAPVKVSAKRGMERMRLVLGLMIAALAGPSLSVPALAAPDAEQAALNLAIVRGKRLYDYDQAAVLSNDTLSSRVPAEARAQLRGLVVEQVADGLQTTFYGQRNGEPFAIYTAFYKNDEVASDHVVAAGEDAHLSATALLLAKARTAAEPAPRMSCSDRPPNEVALPPETPGGPVAVYRFSPQVEDNSYPFGGHSLVEVADGKVVSSREFTRSCLLMDLRPAPGQPQALVVSHLLDPQPTEVHVFLSLTLQQPIYVVTGERLWLVQGTKITEIDRETMKPK